MLNFCCRSRCVEWRHRRGLSVVSAASEITPYTAIASVVVSNERVWYKHNEVLGVFIEIYCVNEAAKTRNRSTNVKKKCAHRQ